MEREERQIPVEHRFPVERRYYEHSPSDETDLYQLILKVWAVRVPVVIAFLLVNFAYWGFWAFQKANSPNFDTYSRIIQLTFKGIASQKYPNGSPFRLADIVGPSILSLVYDTNKLKEHGISETDFVQGFNIQSYTPDYNLIVKRYESALNAKRITSEQITSLQEKLKAELAQASLSSARITFTLGHKDSLPKDLINKVLLDVPRLWAEKSITANGVIKLDVPIYSNKIFDIERLESMDYLVSLDLLEDNAKLMLKNIEQLMNQPNGLTIRDQESGYNLLDLRKAINDILDYDLQALLPPILDLGITKHPESLLLYYQHKIRHLRQQKEYMLKRADIVSNTFDQYADAADAYQLDKDHIINNIPVQQESGSNILLLNQDGRDLNYRQKLSNEILVFRHNAAKMDLKIKSSQQILDAIQNNTTSDGEFKNHHLDLLSNSFPMIIEKLQGYVEIINRISSLLSKENLGYSGILYKTVGAGKLKVATNPLLSNRDILIYAILVLFVTLGTLFVAITVHAFKSDSIKTENVR